MVESNDAPITKSPGVPGNRALRFKDLHSLDIIDDKELVEIYCPDVDVVRVYDLGRFEFTRCDIDIYDKIKNRVVSFIEPRYSQDKNKPYLRISLV